MRTHVLLDVADALRVQKHNVIYEQVALPVQLLEQNLSEL
jgi:hypothetical protein